MTIDNEVQMAATNPHQYLQCSLLRTQAAGLHVRVVPLLDTTTFDVTIEALASQLVLVPRYVVLETGSLRQRMESEMAALGRMVALVHRAGIELRLVLPDDASHGHIAALGVTPADGLYSSVEAAVLGRAVN